MFWVKDGQTISVKGFKSSLDGTFFRFSIIIYQHSSPRQSEVNAILEFLSDILIEILIII